ncbi:GL14074 [Drosophila persimilis]|uniref:GL14074 n=1 Tax=Drosophila persimilis TaxID=7234 RepID=B4HCY4_DROPE|nr:GL14074 [Drosophila persimilis]
MDRHGSTGWQKSTKVSQWRWVPTSDNVAVDATRSKFPVDLSQKARWLGGPAFLRQPAGSCPHPETGFERVPNDNDEEEMAKILKVQAATTVWVIRFTRWCRGQSSELENYGLTAAECEAAENLLVRQAQREAFLNEMRSTEWTSIRQSGCRIMYALM